jgi:predicted metalloenzyme YecM/RimJ/RimL family protein N-acetyltransferase
MTHSSLSNLKAEFSRASAVNFVSQIIQEMNDHGLIVSKDSIDHVCFRVDSLESYSQIKDLISGDAECEFKGQLLSEAIINARPISSYLLDQPIKIANQLIDVLEIPAPKPSKSYLNGFEHIEIVIDQTFDEFQRLHPHICFDGSGLSNPNNPELYLPLKSGLVKFHHRSLKDIIVVEKNEELNNIPQFFLPVLIGPSIRVRPIEQNDFDALFLAASDPLIWQQHSEPDRWEKPVFSKFFASASGPPSALVIEDRKSKEVIGSTRFYGFNKDKKSVAVGYTFFKRAYWGTGANQELKKLILDHAFSYVEQVVFHASEGNLRSQAAIAKLGCVKRPEIIEIPGVGKRVEFVLSKQKWLKY